jgi:alpha-beta hydrolase superfamily lysophospholipase
MRSLFALPLMLAAAACNAQPVGNAATDQAATASASEAVILKAADGVTVYGRYTKAAKPKALILLFHQAGSSKDEYATIAPRLAEAGYSSLAIDQRAGGGLYGTNETAKAFGREADYL